MNNFKNFIRAFLILLCFIPLVGFGACGLLGIFTAAVTISPIPLVLGVAGLVICALLYKLIRKIASK
ncbi:MAG: hypothetical protein V4495_04905 [Pseudomonadota bacterium]